MKLLREPLVHFLALGVALFLLFGLVGERRVASADRIVVDAARVQLLAEGFQRTWQRPPTTEELAGLVEDHIREEVYYREALAMGLDRDDTIVRRRLRQKLEFFADSMLDAVEPSDEELGAYLADHAERFRIASRVTFEHIYFNRDRRGEGARADAESLRHRLETGEESRDPETLGDRLPLPTTYRDAAIDQIGYRFGSSFAEQLAELPEGRWDGPIESGYGLHLVRIQDRQSGELPQLQEVRDAVEREWRAAQERDASEAFYRRLRERYEVVVEPPAADAIEVAEG